MKAIRIKYDDQIPESYTGIVEYYWGVKAWFLNGYLHREDGPAVVWPDGMKAYYLNNEFLNESKINQFINEFEYPVEIAIKLTYLLEMNERTMKNVSIVLTLT